MRALALGATLLALAVLGLPAAMAGPAPLYTPSAGDTFHYQETIAVNGGVGNYTGYTDETHTTGSIGVLSVLPNGTESADYQNTQSFADNEGHSQTISSAGNFTFSAVNYRYVQGTDNQTGYTNPYVWFFMNAKLPVGGTFYLLDTMMLVISLNASCPAPLTSTGYARTIEGQGSGSYQRDDAYGRFTATYGWNAYFDPATGYIVGYQYSETDRNGSNGFTYTDTLGLTSASYSLTAAAPPPVPSAPSSVPVGAIIAGLVALVLLVLVIVVVAIVASRRLSRLPRHSGPMGGSPATWAPPPPISLTGGGGPAPQVVLRDTVKVNCRYCGTLIDSTATVCPKCGAPRN